MELNGGSMTMELRTNIVKLGVACLAASLLASCSSGGSSTPALAENPITNDGVAEAPPLTPNKVIGTITLGGSAQVAFLEAALTPGETLQVSLDGGVDQTITDHNGSFAMESVQNGNHSLFVHMVTGAIVEIPFRMSGGMSLSLGKIRIQDGMLADFTGFNGYHFGFVDADGDGVNDNFKDANGDGIVDMGMAYGGYSYLMPHGFQDADGDGVNDLFRDADGNGANDLDSMPYMMGFGWVDSDADGVNDRFMDADGNGICDLTGMPFQHPFGWMDADRDGVNDLFVDADGNGINDINGSEYIGMPGWVDLDGDGVNDFFHDADGNGLNDLTDIPMGYGHGFGWVDADGDGVNDHFSDADGDGVNDLMSGPFAGMENMYGFMGPMMDGDGNGIDDNTSMPYMMGFGWVDVDMDGINDVFADQDGDGVNDWTGHTYYMGFGEDAGFSGSPMQSFEGWPMPSPGMGFGPGPGMGGGM
jgi:hypothetical protein